MTSSLNGVNVDQLVGTIQAVQGDSSIALFKFKSQTKWIDGGHSQTKIKDFFGAKQEDTTRPKAFVMDGDEPSVLLGNNHGPNAVEAILHALASCLSVGVVYNASAKGIKINALTFDMQGEIDLHAFLGLSETMRPGYSQLDVAISLDAEASREDLVSLIEYVKKTSPVLDVITNPTPVNVTLN